jgi:hypothetical protein
MMLMRIPMELLAPWTSSLFWTRRHKYYNISKRCVARGEAAMDQNHPQRGGSCVAVAYRISIAQQIGK